MVSKNLRIKIIRDGDTKVDMTLPIFSLSIIETLMPENVIGILKSKNICLEEIIADIKRTNYEPQTVFELKEENKFYHVWVE